MSNIKAVKAEVENDDTTMPIEWDGHTYTVLKDTDEWPVDITEAFEDGRASTAIRGLLGPAQWKAFKATKPTNRDLGQLFQEIAQAYGFESSGE